MDSYFNFKYVKKFNQTKMIEKSVEQYEANIYLDLFGGGVFSWQE